LRSKVVIEPLPAPPRCVAGADVGFRGGWATVAVVVLDYPALHVVEQVSVRAPVSFPYIPGLLSFREAPAVLTALERLRITPDVLMIDGQGLAHPRRFGLACHLGVLLDWPTIGCAKSLLVGRYASLLDAPGSVADLVDKGQVVGAAVRTRRGASPVIISVGHRVDLTSAIHVVLDCARGYRLPEPTRLAHRLASAHPPESSELPGR
jgi:deoxyribonuclease V